MNRSSFIRSLALLIAAPSVIIDVASNSTAALDVKKPAFWFKITEEMQSDIPLMDHLLNSKNSWVYKNALEKGVDLSKPFEMKVGYHGDDFTKNLLTAVITQKN